MFKTRCITRQEACCPTMCIQYYYKLHVEQIMHVLHPLHFFASLRVVHAAVCLAFIYTIITTLGHLLLCKARIFKCPVWAVTIKWKGSKVKSAGFFLQRRNLVVMSLCTSLCSAAQGRATVHILLSTGGTGAYRL